MTGAEVPSKRSSGSTTTTTQVTKKARTSTGATAAMTTATRERKITDFVSVSTTASTTPKKVSGVTTAELGLTTFSPSSYLASLSSGGPSPTTRELLALEVATLDSSWLALLQKEITKQYFIDLKRFLWNEGVQGEDSKTAKVFPPAKDIYSWSRYCPLEKVKVVVIGQDPYHDDGQAHGLCFSVRPGVAVPPSLRNIYKELSNEYIDFVTPKTGDLTPWARSGVLLLNTSLTVHAHKAGSHSNKGWETFTDKVVDLVDRFGGSDGVGKLGKGVVFLAWGAWAAKRVAKLDKKKHLILRSAHPSPLSAHRGFLGNGHFKQANEWLEAKYGAAGKIDWSSVCPKSTQTTLDNGASAASGGSNGVGPSAKA